MAPAPRFTSQRTLAPQKAPGLYRSIYDPELGAAICRRLASGESLRAICRADVAMPTERTVWNWARAHEAFAMMKSHALASARAASLAAQGERDAARRAAMGAGKRTAWNAGVDGYDREVTDEVCARLMGGETLAGICARPGMPSQGTIYNWLRRYPQFLARYRWAKSRAPDIMVQDACEDLPWIGKRASWVSMGRAIRASDKRAAQVSLKRYAPATGPQDLEVRLVEPDGTARVIYGGGGEGTT